MTSLRTARAHAATHVAIRAAALLALAALFCCGSALARPTRAGNRSQRSRLTRTPPLILISFDGFRWDYPRRYDAPHLARMAQAGTKARYLTLAFPTKTFPNHYTTVTGLYPAHHGIISNNIYDPVFDASFSLGNQKANRNARWWGGEPLWVTAEKQGLTAATYFWPGSEAPEEGVRPTYRRAYDGSVPAAERVGQVLRWLDLPAAERPDFITLYFGAVDHAGHGHGPSSQAVAQAVKHVDDALGQLYDGLAARGLADSVNVLVTSDHGMASLSPDRVVYLDDYLTGTDGRPGLDALRVTELTPILMAWPDSGQTGAVLDALRDVHPALDVYRKDAVPERLHFSGSRRIPPIIGIAAEGWSIAPSREYAEEHRGRYTGGTHGYVPSAPSMHGLLYARGPAFARGKTARPVASVNLYEMMCRLLGLTPAPNDGNADALRALVKPSARPREAAQR